MSKKTVTSSPAKKTIINSDLLAGFVLGFVVGVLFLSLFGSMM
jgi:uncharacterized membrane protein YgaE (UPF0421/DUF939 family)